MSQNDELLKEKGLKVLNRKEREELRAKWQAETWQDMKESLNMFGKFIMLRPTGFGKTYTCAQATNLDCVKNKKVIFVYKSEILKQTFEAYAKSKNGNEPVIKNHENIIYETYAKVGRHWKDINYLEKELDIKNVGLIIFDECQYMGAQTYRESLDIALQYIGHQIYSDEDNQLNTVKAKYHIPYIGATATIERNDIDVCDKYFTYKNKNNELIYCWGEHLYTLEDAIKTGLLIPPEYVYIETNRSLLDETRKTRAALLKDMIILSVDEGLSDEANKNKTIETMKDLQTSVIANADRIVHDTMLNLYKCPNKYENKTTRDVARLMNTLIKKAMQGNKEDEEKLSKLQKLIKEKNEKIEELFKYKESEELPTAKFGEEKKPDNLPEYMRFLVFTPDRDSMGQLRKNSSGTEVFEGLVGETMRFFQSAFGRYGYHIRTTIISSASSIEKNNVELIDRDISRAKSDTEAEKIIRKQPMYIDLIFSINMLNVGYHVNEITGLVLRRWTGSNQIFYQQLGRCLSADSPNIPVVFDFVNSISKEGITAPMFAVDNTKRALTEKADGTTNVEYKDKPSKQRKNEYTTDKNGNITSQKWVNALSSNQIIIKHKTSTVEELLARMNVYENSLVSKSIYDDTYMKYKDKYLYTPNKNGSGNILISDVHMATELYSELRINLVKYAHKKAAESGKLAEYRNVSADTLSQNALAMYQYIKKIPNAEVFIEYTNLRKYIKFKNSVNTNEVTPADFRAFSIREINTFLAIAKTKEHPETPGVRIKLLLNEKDMLSFKTDKEVQEVLRGKLFNSSDIITYTLEN